MRSVPHAVVRSSPDRVRSGLPLAVVVSVGNDAKAANFPVGVVENGEILPVQFGSPERPS